MAEVLLKAERGRQALPEESRCWIKSEGGEGGNGIGVTGGMDIPGKDVRKKDNSSREGAFGLGRKGGSVLVVKGGVDVIA